LEVALVQICTLADLQAIADVVQGLSQNLNPAVVADRPALVIPPATPVVADPQSEDVKKKESLNQEPSASLTLTEPKIAQKLDHDVATTATYQDTVSQEPSEIDQANEPLQQLASIALGLEGLARQLATLAIEVIEPQENQWEVRLAKEAQLTISKFSSPENMRRLTDGLKGLTGRDLQLRFVITDKPMPHAGGVQSQESKQVAKASQPQRIREVMADPLIKRFIEILGGEVTKVDDLQA